MFGFELHEALSGSGYLLDAPLKDFAVRVEWTVRVSGVRAFLKERRAEVSGTAVIEGLAQRPGGASINGSLTWKLLDEKRVPYDLAFQGDDGRIYRLRGQRDFFVHDAIDSLTILPASVYDDEGREVARVVLRFDPRSELVPMLRSVRPRFKLAR